MQIDNLEAAQDLCDRLEATIPFTVQPTKQLLKTMIDRGDRASVDDVFTVDWVKYSGDVGGINCAFEYLEGGTICGFPYSFENRSRTSTSGGSNSLSTEKNSTAQAPRSGWICRRFASKY